MSFSASDLAAIKSAIEADATAAAYIAAGNPGACADYLNAASSGPTLIWRPDIPVSELLDGVIWSAFVALSTGAIAAWQALTSGGTVDATSANVRAGFVTIFGSGSQTLTNLSAIAQRPASRLEGIFTTSQVCSHYGEQIDSATVQAAMVS